MDGKEDLLFLRMDGNHSRVEWDGIPGFPADVTGAFPFPVARLEEDLLGGFVNIEPIAAVVASVQLDHILTDDVFGCEAQEPLHPRVDVPDHQLSVRDCDQLCVCPY